MIFRYKNHETLSAKDLSNYQGELKNPLENKNKHIRIKGPTPNTKRTIFAVLDVGFFSSFAWDILEVIFFLDFLLGISKIDLENYNSKYKLRVLPYQQRPFQWITQYIVWILIIIKIKHSINLNVS